MKHTPFWRRLFGRLVLGAGLASAGGCLGFLHPLDPPPYYAEACHGMSAAARRHVYIFFVNGIDPVNLGNLTGLRDYVQSLGFSQTYYGQLYHTSWFASELRRIRAQDPEARFVLVGFSQGAAKVHSLAESAAAADVTIDLMVYLSGNNSGPLCEHRPANVERIVVMASGDGTGQDATADGTEVYYLTDASHFGTPGHRHTLETLAQELLAISSRVALPGTPPPLPADPETAPTPRPVPATAPVGQRDEWDFLQPKAQLEEPALK
jgi:pimeloyl-ACP methyl ester carboxylesterase